MPVAKVPGEKDRLPATETSRQEMGAAGQEASLKERFEELSIETVEAGSEGSAPSNVRLRESPSPPRTTGAATPSNTGHLGSLIPEQREALLQLWGLVLSQFGQPYDPTPAAMANGGVKRKASLPREEIVSNLRRLQAEAYHQTCFELDEQTSAAMETNPLTSELFTQCSTDDPDRILLRFLRARRWVVADAFTMLMDCLKWRHLVGLRRLMAAGELALKPALLEGGKNYFWKEDREGRLVCYIRSRLHDKNAQSLQETIDFTIYTVEIGRRLRRHDEQLVTTVFDLRDAPLASLDIPCMQFMVGTLQAFYPEILGKCLILDAPWIFSGFWRLVKPLLDPIVAAKIEFVKREELPQYIDPASLPVEYGGVDPFRYLYSPPLPSPAKEGGEGEGEGEEERESEAQLLLARLAILRTRFVECTCEMHSLVSRVEDARDLEKLLVPIRERRDELKLQLQRCHRSLDQQVLPLCWYQRIGVLSDEFAVQWDKYHPVHSAQTTSNLASLRASAPPEFPMATTKE